MASTSLSDDIQRALQQAVGDANNAARLTQSHVHGKHQKKSKRHREDETQSSGDCEGGDEKRKKKSMKQHGNGESRGATFVQQAGDAISGETTPTSSGSGSGSGSSQPPTLVAGALEDPTTASAVSAAKKNKKKKDKGKERAQEEPSPAPQPAAGPPPTLPPAGTPMDLTTSSMDFLSVVVAAASAAEQQSQGGPPFEQSLQHYMTYPPPDFDPYAFSAPPSPHSQAQGPHPHAQPSHGQPFPGPFPDPNTLPPDILHFASSEDLLRSLQEFDISKVVTVLKTLGEAAAAANVQLNGPPMFAPGLQPPPGPPVQQQPVGSEAILGRPPKQKKGKNAAGAQGAPAPLQHDNPEHAHMLANVWMNAAKLAHLVKTEGLVYKKGKFSATEEAQLNAAIEQYRVTQGLEPEELSQIIFSNKLGKEKGHESFWPEITSALHLRPIIAVYHHVRRARHPFAGKGTWTKTEDDLLLRSVQELGQSWEKISDIVQRAASDCRDRYRNHLQDREFRRIGTWTREEEEELTRIVTEMTVDQGKDIDNDIFWGVVSQKMGGKRGRQQCRIKWTDSLAPQIKNTGERPRWSAMDAYILVHKVDSMNVRDDTEIDWKLLPDENWNIWSVHSLQRRWLTMKRSIKGYEEMSHGEIMEILKTKKAQSPPPSSGRKKKNKYLSAEAVDDVDDMEIQPQASSSTAPGTLAGTGVIRGGSI